MYSSIRNLLFLAAWLGFGLNQSTHAQTLKELEAMAQKEKPQKMLGLVNKHINDSGLNAHNISLRSMVLMSVDADKCWESMQEGVKKFPNEAVVYYTRSLFFYEVRDIQNGLKDLDKALDLAKEDTIRYRIYISRAGMNHFAGNVQKSIDDSKNALLIRPQSKDALNNLAGALFDNGQTAEAKETLLKLKEVDPNYVGVYVNLGYQLQKLEQYEEAAKYLQEGLKIAPEEPFLWNNLGYVQFKLGKIEEGIKSVQKSIKINPNNPYCYRNLALIYLSKNDKEKACEQINKSLAYKFTEMYGEEVLDLKKQHCLKWTNTNITQMIPFVP